jgi:hypothetical protein
MICSTNQPAFAQAGRTGMAESIFKDFLEHTTRAGLELAALSDVLDLERLPVAGEGLFAATYHVAYLARRAGGGVQVEKGPLEVMIRMGPEYLRQVAPLEIVQVGNTAFFHPNFRWPVLCVGEVRPGMMLSTLLRHVFEIVTYQNYATNDGLDLEACIRLRNEPELLDRLPRVPRLVRRPLEVRHAEVHAGPSASFTGHADPQKGGSER